MRIGVIGLDSSHTFEFSRRIQDFHARGMTPCRVTCCWAETSSHGPDLAVLDAAAERLSLMGIRRVASLDALLSDVDAVMVLAVDGHRHFEFGMKCLKERLPTFIDKPLTCSAAEAKTLVAFVRDQNGRCFSASALRFTDELSAAQRTSLARQRHIDAEGPVQSTAHMDDLWYYGCHTFELVDSIWPTPGGVQRVRATRDAMTYRIEQQYFDGRTAVIGLDRTGGSPFRVRVRSGDGSGSSPVAPNPSYDRLVGALTQFFEGHAPPIDFEKAAEIVFQIEGCRQSLRRDGKWVELLEFSDLGRVTSTGEGLKKAF